ncbi:hypothetical protein CLV78_101303 [Aliiruegeria haliotis]|uniref:Uncharacterized protein n=2 Tax=Aliiruegeria haliotis TaxID=1280846 RepID=A0A2T0RYG4_9RHOB|nr:hypothetical protein CLV78_101303 [Aliiruegeria haliotis]
MGHGAFFVSLDLGGYEQEQVNKMDNITLSANTGEDTGQFFDQAVELYRSGSRELTDIIAEVGKGKTDRAKKLQGVLSEMRKASITMMEEARNVEDLRRKLVGNVQQQALDLAGARVEIGSRIARIRAARGAAGIS